MNSAPRRHDTLWSALDRADLAMRNPARRSRAGHDLSGFRRQFRPGSNWRRAVSVLSWLSPWQSEYFTLAGYAAQGVATQGYHGVRYAVVERGRDQNLPVERPCKAFDACRLVDGRADNREVEPLGRTDISQMAAFLVPST